MIAADSAHLDALQAAVAGEHAAVWASGRAAGLLGSPDRRTAQGELDDHRRARDELRARITALGAQPVDAAVAYVEPFPVRGARGARRLMAHVNAALAATYADVAAASERDARRDAATRSSQAAVRAVSWGASAQAFPGS